MTVAAVDETVQVHDAMWLQRVKIISDKFYRKFPTALETQIHRHRHCQEPQALPAHRRSLGGRGP